ncbi:ubiquitin carboxyl-terminal hydrolase MINDY-3/4 [Paragonimus westermani]|uniref:Ubiquitin carboxyl-terminal hydrolase MINDY n=1 Tax=Paragonimus westermani TaxID=34504 RepID=A0A5J4N8E2_9TREM|nr:ubiquitin carboxyl-terminal hydrolase MINDY-3/4 [Paragonimus westermani]
MPVRQRRLRNAWDMRSVVHIPNVLKLPHHRGLCVLFYTGFHLSREAFATVMSCPSPTELSELNKRIWGKAETDPAIFRRWCQGFYFSSAEPTALIQDGGGPCAILAPVQAVILRDLLFSKKQSLTDLDGGLFTPYVFDQRLLSGLGIDGSDLLIGAILEIMVLVKCDSEATNWKWIYWSYADSDQSTIADEPPGPDRFFRGLKTIEADSAEELHGIIMSLATELQSPYAVLCFLYSILFTYGLSALRKSMADETEPLIDPVHGHASQCLINLLITGQVTPYLFDRERTVSGIPSLIVFPLLHSLADTLKQLDPENFGVILEEPFLQYFFPWEMANRRLTVQNFQIVHYNGLEKSNLDNQVRYQIGDAHLLDPTEELLEKEPVDQNPIHRCLRTKWPTIRIKWKTGRTPSLN